MIKVRMQTTKGLIFDCAFDVHHHLIMQCTKEIEALLTASKYFLNASEKN